MKIRFDHQLCVVLLVIKVNKCPTTHGTPMEPPIRIWYIIVDAYNIRDILQSSLRMPLLACTILFTLGPRRHLHMLFMHIATYRCPKGILGLRGNASKIKLKDTKFNVRDSVYLECMC